MPQHGKSEQPTESWLSSTMKLVVKIPAGVREGQRIRLAGMGHEGKDGGAPGDLFLEVRLRRPALERIKTWAA